MEFMNSTTTSTSNTDTATTANTSHSATSTSRTMAAVRNIFAPYQPYSANRTGLVPDVLILRKHNVAPTREEKDMYKANLESVGGEYPKLRGIGGFELLRTQARSRCDLEVISVPPGGYTDEVLPPFPKKRNVIQTPVCQFACLI
ncbi:hypothetical protein MAR_027589 [Mya arenaria]|uniref:Uncharacterized protein n=1 Tax=Mya arenaria TaxID=6604 RepID=A0ABY7EWB7_MYAAR|nr:hypothetical protein MAR_027589 [Mya arenaria]